MKIDEVVVILQFLMRGKFLSQEGYNELPETVKSHFDEIDMDEVKSKLMKASNLMNEFNNLLKELESDTTTINNVTP